MLFSNFQSVLNHVCLYGAGAPPIRRRLRTTPRRDLRVSQGEPPVPPKLNHAQAKGPTGTPVATDERRRMARFTIPPLRTARRAIVASAPTRWRGVRVVRGRRRIRDHPRTLAVDAIDTWRCEGHARHTPANPPVGRVGA